MRIIKNLEKSVDFWFLMIFLTVFFFLRLPSLFEPYWYGDEGIYQTIGLALNRGALLYRDIWDNKPPLLYFLYSIFGSEQFTLRLLSLLFGLAAIVVFLALSKKLLNKPLLYRASTVVFTVLFGLPLIEGNIANAENFMVPLAIFSAYSLILFLKSKQKNLALLFLSGVLLGISVLFKIVAIFDFGAFFVFLFILDFPEKLSPKSFIKNLADKLGKLTIFSLAFLLPFLMSLFYSLINHILSLYLNSVFFSNVDYVGYGNKFIIPQGLLLFKIFLMTTVLLIIFFKRKGVRFPAYLFITIWAAFSLFNSFFSQRPYPHYVLVLLPAFCLFFGSIFLYNKLSRILATIFIISLGVILHYFSLDQKNVGYYENFINFVFDSKAVARYQSFFDGNTPRDYEISSFIKSKARKEDNVFVWGNNAQIYKLTDKTPPGKYTTLYHIVQYSDGLTNTKEALYKKTPKFIIVMPSNYPYPFSLYNYKNRIIIEGAVIYERGV